MMDHFFGAHFNYAVQEKTNGIAEALTIGKDFIDNDGVCLITGDTILSGDSLPCLLTKAEKAINSSGAATIFVKRDPEKNSMEKSLLNNSEVREHCENKWSVCLQLHCGFIRFSTRCCSQNHESRTFRGSDMR